MAETEVKLRAITRTPSSWDPQDDILLRKLKEQQKLGWKEISSHFTNRTPNLCQFRWRRLRSGSLKNSTTSTIPIPQLLQEEQKISIQPKNIIRRHSLLSSSTSSTPIISSNSRSGSFTDLQSTNSVSSNESATTSNTKNRQRSYSTTTSNTSASIYHQDDPLSSSAPPSSASTSSLLNTSPHYLHNSGAPGAGIGAVSATANGNSHLNPHHLRPLNSSSSTTSSTTPRHPPFFLQQQLQLPAYGMFHQNYHQMWDEDEDDLLLCRRERELSFTELSILLPSKSEMDIWLRIEYLENGGGALGNGRDQSNLKNHARGRKNSTSLPQLSRSLSISSSISNQSGGLSGLLLASRENSIIGSMDTHHLINPPPSQANHSAGNMDSDKLLIKEEKDFTKKRSIKLPSLGSILNNF